jgi:hypothetical protein
LKTLIYRFSPGVLHAFYQRVEASPLGYRLAKGGIQLRISDDCLQLFSFLT